MLNNILFAEIVDEKTIKFNLSSALDDMSADKIRVWADGRERKIALASLIGTLGRIELSRRIDLSRSWRIEIEGCGYKDAIPTDIFGSQYFADNFHYDGGDLGAIIDGDKTSFKLWAPTASRVTLNLFEAGDGIDAYRSVPMDMGDKGVWSHTEECGHGTYYTYTVTTAVGTQEAVDPYARAVGVNGERGMVVDLSLTDPDGWGEAKRLDKPIGSYSEAIIWEVHVRDFSNKIAASLYKGKYLAFTERGLVNEHGEAVGIDYLVNLGITHVHLLPIFDYATVDERDPQAQFNWGYDPQNYNAPEGSYSTDAHHGEVRIREFKEMVRSLHLAGIGVIMDMVYNHTYDSNGSLNKIVPYYYYRYTPWGENISASGCGNDTASERYMFGKLMVESVSYWVEEYGLDGIRFDLMGLHDLATMQRIESAVHTINPNAIIYGEGWTMGATVDGSAQADLRHIAKIKPTGSAIGAIAVFNDVMRDGLKGSVFDIVSRGFINGAPNGSNIEKVIFGIGGGAAGGFDWQVDNSMVINYMSAHDNHALWDKLMLSNPEASDTERYMMNNLGAAILLISKGTPFWQAGEEMLRSKGGEENSYSSSDEVNNIDWSVLKKGAREYNAMRYYKGLIEMRKAYDVFTDSAAVVRCEELTCGMLAVFFENGNGGKAIALINPHSQALSYTLDAEWNMVVDRERSGSSVLEKEFGGVIVDAIEVRIYVNDALIGKK